MSKLITLCQIPYNTAIIFNMLCISRVENLTILNDFKSVSKIDRFCVCVCVCVCVCFFFFFFFFLYVCFVLFVWFFFFL